jgi:hypothetical protein
LFVLDFSEAYRQSAIKVAKNLYKNDVITWAISFLLNGRALIPEKAGDVKALS